MYSTHLQHYCAETDKKKRLAQRSQMMDEATAKSDEKKKKKRTYGDEQRQISQVSNEQTDSNAL